MTFASTSSALFSTPTSLTNRHEKRDTTTLSIPLRSSRAGKPRRPNSATAPGRAEIIRTLVKSGRFWLLGEATPATSTFKRNVWSDLQRAEENGACGVLYTDGEYKGGYTVFPNAAEWQAYMETGPVLRPFTGVTRPRAAPAITKDWEVIQAEAVSRQTERRRSQREAHRSAKVSEPSEGADYAARAQMLFSDLPSVTSDTASPLHQTATDEASLATQPLMALQDDHEWYIEPQSADGYQATQYIVQGDFPQPPYPGYDSWCEESGYMHTEPAEAGGGGYGMPYDTFRPEGVTEGSYAQGSYEVRQLPAPAGNTENEAAWFGYEWVPQ